MNAPATPPLKTSELTRELVAKGQQYYVPNYKPREMILDHGQGARVWDLDGNEYIDFSAGIAVNSLGHQDPELVQALTEQAHKLWHTSNVFFTEPAVRLAEELVKASGFATRVFFSNSGAEANEAAIKLVRKWAAQQGRGPERRDIITFKGSFHGRTLTTVTATAQPKYQEGFEPLPGGFRYCEFNDFEAIAAMVDANTAAIMVEPVQGEGGITPCAPGFLAHLRKLCDQVGALLVLDEIQCGMARTGKLFAHQWDGITPDVMTVAKALGCGFPIGAMLAGPKVAEVLQFGSHGSTFGGNPMAAAVARVALRRFQSPELLANVERQSKALRDRLLALNEALGIFADIRGRGLMIGAELKGALQGKAGELLPLFMQHGLMMLQAGPNVLRFVPPLNITDEELAAGLARFEAGLRDYLTRI
ncbi:MAG TPA: acetylornithine/succinyldiaminopimelate transaminase [Candidatus Competibacteraceae bacterium]|nr:acetylornithine/succinyldiaminopimelate transaminase [Candidatus Competibacteraceae bacterium]